MARREGTGTAERDRDQEAEVVPPLLRNLNFQLLWGSQFISTIGSRASRLSYPLLVLAVAGSPGQASMVAAALTLPMPLLYLVSGPLIDRFDHKRMLLLCEIIRTAALGSLAIAVFFGAVHLAHMIIVAFVEGSCFVFLHITESVLIPRVVPRCQLPSAIATNQARTSGAELIGQPLGGLLFSISWAVPFLAGAVSYLVSCCALLALRTPSRTTRSMASDSTGRPNLRQDLVTGLRWFVRQRGLLSLAVVIGLVNLLFAALPLMMIVRAEQAGATSRDIGWMFAMLSCGAIAGAVVAPRLSRRVKRWIYLCAAPWFWSGCILALAISFRPFVLGCIIGAAMLLAPTFNVITSTYWYRVTPDEVQGRSQSVLRLITWGTLPLGSLTAGWLTSTTTTTAAFAVLAAGMALIAAGLGFSALRRYLRSIDD